MRFIYKITNLINGKIYIGQTKLPNGRWSQHKYQAQREKPLQVINVAMKKYGIDNFKFEVIASCLDSIAADEAEKELIKTENSQKFGYNISNGGPTAPKTEEWKRKSGESRRGKKIHSEETKEKLRKLNLGKKASDATKLKMSIAVKSRTKKYFRSEETKEKLRRLNLGKKASQETVEKMRKSMLGKNKGKPGPRGDCCGNSKLTWQIVDEIRQEYKNTKISYPQLAKKYNISVDTVGSVIRKNTWKDSYRK